MAIYIYDYKKAYGGGLLFLDRPNRKHSDEVAKERGSQCNGCYKYWGTLREFSEKIKEDGEYDDSWEE